MSEWNEKPASSLPDDFWRIAWPGGTTCVSADAAREVEQQLDREPTPRWVHFRDLSGRQVRVRARLIEIVLEETAEQRAFERAFNRARKSEEKAEKDWSQE